MTKCIECGTETQIGYQRCHAGPYCLTCSKKPVEEWEDEPQNESEKDRKTTPSANENDIVFRLRKRAEIRRQISTRKSVQEGKPDRISDLLEEAAMEIERLRG